MIASFSGMMVLGALGLLAFAVIAERRWSYQRPYSRKR